MPRTGKNRWLQNTSWAAAVGSLLGLLTACSASSGAAATSCTTPGISDKEVRVGLLLSDTGSFSAALTAYRAGIDARLGTLNAQGGVNNRKIIYSWADDADNPDRNSTAARSLVEQQQIFGLMEGATGASGSAAYLNKAGIPVTGLGTDPTWGKYQNMFAPFYDVTEGAVTTWGDFIRSEGGTRAVLVRDEQSGRPGQIYAQQETASLQAAGVTVALTAEITPDISDFNRLADQMKAAHIDTITGGVTPPILAKLIPAARAANLPLKVILAPTGYEPTLLTQLGQVLAGTTIYLNSVPFELNTPAQQRLLAAMAQYAPQIQPPNQQSAVDGWLTADLFIRGLQEAGSCPTRADFIRALRNVHNYDGDGLLPAPVDLSTNLGKPSKCLEFVRISDDGRSFVPLHPSLRCGKLLT